MPRKKKYKTVAEREAAIKEYRKWYNKEHKERLRKQQDEWRERNPERVAEYRRRSEIKRKANGGEKQREYNKRYYETHKEQQREYQRNWVERNKEHVREYQRNYQRMYAAAKRKKKGKGKVEVNVKVAASLFSDPVQKAHFMWIVNHNKNNKSK